MIQCSLTDSMIALARACPTELFVCVRRVQGQPSQCEEQPRTGERAAGPQGNWKVWQNKAELCVSHTRGAMPPKSCEDTSAQASPLPQEPPQPFRSHL